MQGAVAQADDAPHLPRPPFDAALIAGSEVDLERLDPPRHGPDLWQAIGRHDALWLQIPSGPFPDETAFGDWLVDRSRRDACALYAIVLRGEPRRAAGLFFLMQIAPQAGTVEMGLVYGEGLQRQRAGTEAFFRLADHVLHAQGYRRLEWRCGSDHAGSRRAALRYGFTREGTLRQTNWIKGRNWDTAVYSILDREWPVLSARLARWLAPENRGPDGRQIVPLADIDGTRPDRPATARA
ncbi:MAG TPA: GNAT family protein [Microvirga sp.]|jgi:RimJ/RimL family protein N-acetyltransferase|nr:GNAT family protein [Microvirga sp.]